METEYVTVWQAFLAMIGLSVACLLYSLGGRSDKIIRRLGGAITLAGTVNLLCLWRGIWNPWMLCLVPALFTAFSMGYGGEETWYKIVRRIIYASGVLCSGLIMCLILGGASWFLFLPHVAIGIWSVWLGVKNPLEAAAEETLVCAALNLCLVFYPFITPA